MTPKINWQRWRVVWNYWIDFLLELYKFSFATVIVWMRLAVKYWTKTRWEHGFYSFWDLGAWFLPRCASPKVRGGALTTQGGGSWHRWAISWDPVMGTAPWIHEQHCHHWRVWEVGTENTWRPFFCLFEFRISFLCFFCILYQRYVKHNYMQYDNMIMYVIILSWTVYVESTVPPLKPTCPRKKGPFQKEISSSNHRLSEDMLVFRGATWS